jgi:hypothetical protein
MLCTVREFIIGGYAIFSLSVVVPGATDDDDPLELAVPEQFVSKVQNGKLATSFAEHVYIIQLIIHFTNMESFASFCFSGFLLLFRLGLILCINN